MTKKRKRKTANLKHDRHCSYWAGCDPFSGEEGYCDCGLSESELEVYVVLSERIKSVSVREKAMIKPKEKRSKYDRF